MQASTDRILTTHAGSLPRPSDLADLNAAKMRGEAYDEQARSARIPGAIRVIVREQVHVGLDVINDGECSKTNFLTYAEDRLSGFERAQTGEGFFVRRDWRTFSSFYRDSSWGRRPGSNQPVCVGPIAYRGQALIEADIANLQAAIAETAQPTRGICSIRNPVSRSTADTPRCVWMRSTTAWPACPRTASATTSAGAAGLDRI
jgi:5-methyltetrahydropteroyltriglutamate--homocysteine methyltransferase